MSTVCFNFSTRAAFALSLVHFQFPATIFLHLFPFIILASNTAAIVVCCCCLQSLQEFQGAPEICVILPGLPPPPVESISILPGLCHCLCSVQSLASQSIGPPIPPFASQRSSVQGPRSSPSHHPGSASSTTWVLASFEKSPITLFVAVTNFTPPYPAMYWHSSSRRDHRPYLVRRTI